MSRTTEAAVIAVLGMDYDSVNQPSLTGYIETASALVDDVVECAARRDLTISSLKLELLERWLSAHCYALSDQPYKARATLRASGQFQGETGMYLEATKYGQMAATLDTTGCLNALGKRLRVSAFWIGKRPSEQVDVDDRD